MQNTLVHIDIYETWFAEFENGKKSTYFSC